MKRLSLTLAALGLSFSVFAALPAATDPTLINVPQLPGGFVIGVTGYYLQPSATHGDLDYAVLNTGTTPNFNSQLESVDPGYDWGWGINAGYIFPDTGNDVNLNYFHLDTDDNDGPISTLVGSFALINPFITGIIPIAGEPASVSGKVEYDINQVDLTVGQFINIGCRLVLHPNVGLRWAEIERKINAVALDADVIAPGESSKLQQGPRVINTDNEKSDFSGIGPLVGLDGSYYIAYGFGIVGHFDSAVLVGDIDSKNSFTTLNQLNSFGTSFTFQADDNRRVVPVVDAKLGADYTFMFNNAANSNLTLEAGYQVSHYFNVIDRVYTNANNAITQRKTSALGLNGPYVNLTLHI